MQAMTFQALLIQALVLVRVFPLIPTVIYMVKIFIFPYKGSWFKLC